MSDPKTPQLSPAYRVTRRRVTSKYRTQGTAENLPPSEHIEDAAYIGHRMLSPNNLEREVDDLRGILGRLIDTMGDRITCGELAYILGVDVGKVE